MYCRNCGKELTQDSRYCPYCGTYALTSESAAEQSTAEASSCTEASEQPKAPAASGVKCAVASTIVAVGSIFAFFISIIWGVALSTAYPESALAGLLIFLTVLAVAASSVIAIVLGVKSIKHFIKVKKEYGEKQVTTLVFGIIGCSVGSFIAFYFALIIQVLLFAGI